MNEDLQRVRSDLEVVRQAAGLGELPFDRSDVKKTMLYCLLGLPLLIFGLIGPTQTPYPEIAIAATLVLVIVGSTLEERAAKRNRAEAPLRWREHKTGLALFLITGGGLAYLIVASWQGVFWAQAVGTAIFLAGMCLAVPAIVDRDRLHYLGGALPTLAYGAVFPMGEERLWMIATALWIILAAVGTAAVMSWQLSRQDCSDASD